MAATNEWWLAATARELHEHALQAGAGYTYAPVFSADHVLLVRLSIACARTVLARTRPEDREVCARAIDTAERWTRGEATAEECRAAWAAADKAANIAAWDAGARERSVIAQAAWSAASAARAAGYNEAWSSAEWCLRSAINAADDANTVHHAARAVLTLEVLRSLELRSAVLGKTPDARIKAQWSTALESGTLRRALSDWQEIAARARPDRADMLEKTARAAREVVLDTVVYLPNATP